MSNNILQKMESSAVQAHISMLQGIINRMANNSANCKTWTITIVAAMLVLLVDKNYNMPNAKVCFIPIALFYLLDCYYLGLERLCIKSQDSFITKVTNGDITDELFIVKGLSGVCTQLCSTIKAIVSFSTTPFYLIVAAFVLFFSGIV